MPALSPNTQAMMAPPPTGEDARQRFEDGFGQMAQNVLSARFPNLVAQVVTFQVLSSDIDSGSAVGVFILERNGKAIQIPVILANNQIKPIDIMFVKDENIFLPLQPGWLNQIDRSNIDELGEGVKPPKDMVTDMDIRNLVIPPAAGRYTYASAKGSKLTDFLTRAPNYVKQAFRLVLLKNRKVLKFAAENYDMGEIDNALAPHIEKTAAAPTIKFLTINSSPAEYRETFGKNAAAAYQFAAQHGYAVKDERPFFKVAVETQRAVWLQEAKSPGFYRLVRSTGETVDAVVVPSPRALTTRDRHGKSVGVTPLRVRNYLGEDLKYLIFTENRDIIMTDTAPVGEMISEPDVSEKLLSVLNSENGAGSGYGVFVRFEAGKVSATVPVSVRKSTTGSDGVRRMETDSFSADSPYGTKTIVTDPKSPIRQMVAPKGTNITYIPPTFKFLTGTRAEFDFVKTAQGNNIYDGLLKKAGATHVRLLNAQGDMFGIGRAVPQTKLATLKQLVINLGLREPEARLMLDKTASQSHHDFYLVSPIQMIKFAMLCKKAQPPAVGPQAAMGPMATEMPAPGAETEAPPPEGEVPPGAEGEMPPGAEGEMPPEMMMDPAMMAPPPPPPPDPVQIAVSEIGSQLASQAADIAKQLAEQQRDLSNQLNVLDAVQQRAQQISAEQSGQPPLPPEAGVGGLPPEVSAPPIGPGPSPVPTEPSMVEPQAGGPMQPGMEGPMASEQLAAQAGPQMEQAAGLAPYGQDEASQSFEATAIGSMATNPDLRGVVSMYLPSLEDALDHMARILLTLWIQEDQYRTELGERDFTELEERLRTVFNNLGQLVLRINQTAMAARPENEVDPHP